MSPLANFAIIFGIIYVAGYILNFFGIYVWDGVQEAKKLPKYWGNNINPPPSLAALIWPILDVMWFFMLLGHLANALGKYIVKKVNEPPKPKLTATKERNDYRSLPACSNCGATIIDE